MCVLIISYTMGYTYKKRKTVPDRWGHPFGFHDLRSWWISRIHAAFYPRVSIHDTNCISAYIYICIYIYTYTYLYNIHVLCYTSMCFSSTYHILTYQKHVSWTQYFLRPCVATACHWASLTNWRHTILSVFLMNLPPEHSFTPPTPAFGNGAWNR